MKTATIKTLVLNKLNLTTTAQVKEYATKLGLKVDLRTRQGWVAIMTHIANTINQPKPQTDAMEVIRELDKELNTNGYLPIYHFRARMLQNHITRAKQDAALYKLQREGKIDLGSVVESGRYTRQQLKQGIHQNAGGPLFFIMIEA
jgi:hypothetical protein